MKFNFTNSKVIVELLNFIKLQPKMAINVISLLTILGVMLAGAFYSITKYVPYIFYFILAFFSLVMVAIILYTTHKIIK